MLGPEEVIDFIKTGQTNTDVEKLYGIIPRAIRDLFIYVNTLIEEEGAQFQISMNYFELFKESLNNLLSNTPSTAENLKISGSTVLNAEPTPVYSPEDIFENIQTA